MTRNEPDAVWFGIIGMILSLHVERLHASEQVRAFLEATSVDFKPRVAQGRVCLRVADADAVRLRAFRRNPAGVW